MKNRNWLTMVADASTRRQLIVGAAVVGSAVMTPKPGWTSAEDGISHAAESIHQEPIFKANRKRVYDALTNAKEFSKVVLLSAAMRSMSLGNEPTEISPQPGGAFKLFGGHIVGRQIELIANQLVVQAWRVADWSPGLYSIVKFELIERGPSTKVVFDHTGFPLGKGEHLAEGWRTNYWEPLSKYLG